MKVLTGVVLWLCLAVAAFGADVKLTWDPGDVTEGWTAVRIYEVNGTNVTKVGEVAGGVVEFTLTNVARGRHVYIVRSVGPWGESVDSNQAITPNLNNPPKNLKWQIVITVP